MMPSEPKEAYVWVWLPGRADPVVAGRLDLEGKILTFTYGQSYRALQGSLPLYLPELPLEQGVIRPEVGEVAGCISDAASDAWGMRVILNHVVGREALDTTDLSLLSYMLESGSDRIGALDFQESATDYVPRSMDHATLDELAESADRVEKGIPLSAELDQALMHGSSIGGARPKALLRDGDRELIAKFSSTTDTYPVIKAEFIAMGLARRAGLNVAPVDHAMALGKDVLLVERFDRTEQGGRKMMISALTILGLDEISGRYATYADLTDVIRARFTSPRETLHELFARITFNILTGNTDDHARNHAAFWDGNMLTLTPAYDICPQMRSGGEATQIMAIGKDGWRYSQVAGCVDRADIYLLSKKAAREIVDLQIDVIQSQWNEVCDAVALNEVDRASMWQRQFLNRYALEGY